MSVIPSVVTKLPADVTSLLANMDSDEKSKEAAAHVERADKIIDKMFRELRRPEDDNSEAGDAEDDADNED